MGPAGCGGLKAASCFASWWQAAAESCRAVRPESHREIPACAGMTGRVVLRRNDGPRVLCCDDGSWYRMAYEQLLPKSMMSNRYCIAGNCSTNQLINSAHGGDCSTDQPSNQSTNQPINRSTNRRQSAKPYKRCSKIYGT